YPITSLSLLAITTPRPPTPTTSPYTTLFRSHRRQVRHHRRRTGSQGGAALRRGERELPALRDRRAPARARDRPGAARGGRRSRRDRKSTRLNSSHGSISYAVFCLKKKKTQNV